MFHTIRRAVQSYSSDARRFNSFTYNFNLRNVISRFLFESRKALTCKTSNETPNKPLPQAPPEGLCCGSGCVKCVWLVYAEELLDYYTDGEKKAFDALKNVPDPNMREFLKMELRMRLPK